MSLVPSLLLTLAFIPTVGFAACVDVLERVNVTLSPRASLRSQELLGLNLLSAPDRLQLNIRREGPRLVLALGRVHGGRTLLDVRLDADDRVSLGEADVRLVVSTTKGLEVFLDVPAEVGSRYDRRGANGVIGDRHLVPVLAGELP